MSSKSKPAKPVGKPKPAETKLEKWMKLVEERLDRLELDQEVLWDDLEKRNRARD